MTKKRYLFVGPCPKQITGQSVIFNQFYNAFEYDKRHLVNSSSKKIKCMFNYPLRLLFYILFYRPNVVYFTSSRTKIGCFRDIMLLFLLFFKKNVRVVNHLHGADFKSFRINNSNWFNIVLDKAYTRIDTSIVLSESMVEQYDCYPEMIVDYVNNFSVGPTKDIKPKLVDSPIKILYLSNIISSKGIFELISAIKVVNGSGRKYELNVAGSFLGDLEIEEKFMNEVNGCDFINYHGSVSGNEKDDLLLHSDFMCLPTYYPTEAQPVCLIEGMNYGCFIITTKHNYIHDFVSECNGVFVEKRSVESLVDTLNELSSIELRDVIFNVSSYNINYAKDNFGISKFLNKIKIILG